MPRKAKLRGTDLNEQIVQRKKTHVRASLRMKYNVKI